MRTKCDTEICVFFIFIDPNNKLIINVCYCCHRCSSCLARWFASRQDQNEKDTWLQSTCRCPMCRSVFCVLDVCMIEPEESSR